MFYVAVDMLCEDMHGKPVPGRSCCQCWHLQPRDRCDVMNSIYKSYGLFKLSICTGHCAFALSARQTAPVSGEWGLQAEVIAENGLL